MLAQDIISITDLRQKTKGIFRSLRRPKFIVSHNKPQAVLLSVSMYEKLIKQQSDRETVVDFGDEGIDPDELLACHQHT